VGVIREVDHGVANIEGLTHAMLNEMIDRGHGITGLAFNLQETEATGYRRIRSDMGRQRSPVSHAQPS